MNETTGNSFTLEELEGEHASQLPDRDLLIAVSVLGIPLAGVDGISINISGPRFLA